MHDNAAGEATKKRPVFGRLLSLSATYVQGSAIAGEWRDEVGSARNSQAYPSNAAVR